MQIDTIKIACDPVLCPKDHIQDYKYFKTKRLNAPVFDESELRNVNLWLLTHNHEDHIDKYGIKMIDTNASIVSHESLKSYLKKDIYKNVQFLKWNQNTAFSFSGISVAVKAVPAIHARNKLLGNQIGNGNGYLLEISKGKFDYSVYITGDSVYSQGTRNYLGSSNIDLIIANAGAAMVGKSLLSRIIGRITNNSNDIKRMITELHPGVLIPVHWGTFSHYSEAINSDTFKNYHNVKLVNIGEGVTLS